MGNKTILVLILRLTALLIFVEWIGNFPAQLADALQAGNDYISPGYIGAVIILPASIKLIFAVVFWFFPEIMLRVVVPKETQSKTGSEYTNSLYIAGIGLVGLWILSQGLIDLIYYFNLKNQFASQLGGSEQLPPQEMANYMASWAEIILGILLIVGNKGINRFLWWLRTVGK